MSGRFEAVPRELIDSKISQSSTWYFCYSLKSTLVVRDRSLLGLDLFDSALEIGRAPFALIHARNEDGSVREKILHLLKRALGGLRQEAVEEDGVGQVADNEEDVEPPANLFHCNSGDLTDHGVQTKRGHCRDGDALRSCLGVEDLRGNNPG